MNFFPDKNVLNWKSEWIKNISIGRFLVNELRYGSFFHSQKFQETRDLGDSEEWRVENNWAKRSYRIIEAYSFASIDDFLESI